MKRKATPKSKLPSSVRAWSPAEREAYRNGQRLRAVTVPSKRRPAPQAREWAA